MSVDAEGKFHLVFNDRRGICHAASGDGRKWTTPQVLHEAKTSFGPEFPQLIHTPNGAVLLYSTSKGEFVKPVDLTDLPSANQPGKPAATTAPDEAGADGSIKITNHVIPICSSQVGLTEDGKVFCFVGQDTTWLLRADVKDLMQRKRGGCRAPMNEELFHPVREAAARAVKQIEEGKGD